MKVFFIFISLLVTSGSLAESQEPSDRFLMLSDFYAARERRIPGQFANLETLEIKDSIIQYVKEGFRIHYNASISEVINEKIGEDGVRDGQGRIFLFYTRTIRTRIDKNENTIYTIDFTPGMSVDPGFIIYRNEGDTLKRIAFLPDTELFGTELYVPGDGFLYVSGHTNSMFDRRRKYAVEQDSLREVVQPFYYVGLDTVTLRDIIIYEDRACTKEVERIPAAAPVTVLLNESDLYLVATSFCVTGWISIPSGYDSPIQHLFFRGD